MALIGMDKGGGSEIERDEGFICIWAVRNFRGVVHGLLPTGGMGIPNGVSTNQELRTWMHDAGF